MKGATQKVFMTPGAKKAKRRSIIVAYSFILPNFLGFLILTMFPILFTFFLSVMSWDSANPMVFAGLEHYRYLPEDRRFMDALTNTIYFTAVTVPGTLVASLAVAMLLNAKVFARTFFRSVFFFPYVASLVALAVVWNLLFHPSMGPVNQFLMSLGVENPPRWTADINWALPTVMLMTVWRNMGYYMIIYL
ncbi:MAG: sugar ABC transporter permease, partial [Oscillospiraceae bacterium]|nr:sugar ABC transporter permease [Oscillospiraceae bacterium]